MFIGNVAAKFGTKKAWHVATRLARRLVMQVATPRNGVQKTFVGGKTKQMAGSVFYATIQALDEMQIVRSFGYKNAPGVSSELVKFLAVNTDFESVKALVEKVKTLETDNKALHKELNKMSSSTQTALNKVDSLQKVVDKLVKKTDKLGAKAGIE